MSLGLMTVLTIVKLTGVVIMGHLFHLVWSYQTTYSRKWCVKMTGIVSIFLFSSAVAANTFISAVYNMTSP